MSAAETTLPLSEAGYRRLLGQIRHCVDQVLPADAAVAVVSRGDDRLLELGDGRVGMHFPQTADGRYAGHHPASSTEALAHLDRLRSGGAEYLLLPQTGFWWLEHYGDLADHLERRCQRVSGSNGSCRIYRLARVQQTSAPAARRLCAFLDALLPEDAVLYVPAEIAPLLSEQLREVRAFEPADTAGAEADTAAAAFIDAAEPGAAYLFLPGESRDDSVPAGLASRCREIARRRHLGRLFELNGPTD